MRKMSKAEQILAQKTVDARRVKNESKSPSKSRSGSNILPQSLSPAKRYSFTATGSRPVTSSGAESRHRIDEEGFENTINQWMDANDVLAQELASRSTTHEGTIRKMTNEALAKTTSSQIDFGENRFLPKVKKVRPDGATLTDVYRSKKEDIWGKILHQQILEEERENLEKRRKKEQADAMYGKLLTDQLHTKEYLEASQQHPADIMAKSKGGTWAQFEIRNAEREGMRSVKHAEFVANALHDIEIKKKKQEKELMYELESSAYLVQKAQMEIALEKEKAKAMKAMKAAEQEKLWEENQEILAKRAREKQMKDQADREYVRQQDEKFQREEDRRQQERDNKAASNSTDRGAYVLAQKVFEQSKKKEEELYQTFLQKENSLSRQLKLSEDATNRRMEETAERLRQAFIKQKQADSLLRDTKSDDQAKVRNAMQEHQRKFLQSQDRQRKARQEAAHKYQVLLDQQLQMNRERSLKSLEETMCPNEQQMNAALFRKYSIDH